MNKIYDSRCGSMQKEDWIDKRDEYKSFRTYVDESEEFLDSLLTQSCLNI